jgi:hypothetical protein
LDSKAYDVQFETKITGVIRQDEKYAYGTLIPNQTAIKWLKQMKADELKKKSPDVYAR